jgi:hypothetical protein
VYQPLKIQIAKMNKDWKTNEKMVKVAPELASSFAEYPMTREYWLDPITKINDNTPAFISHPKDPNQLTSPPLKIDYVYGPGPLGIGYYHLLTRESYISLHRRLRNEATVQCCCFGSSTPGAEFQYEVKNIVYNRSIATRPDDILGQQQAIEKAQGIANSEYQMSQNIQLVVMTVL